MGQKTAPAFQMPNMARLTAAGLNRKRDTRSPLPTPRDRRLRPKALARRLNSA